MGAGVNSLNGKLEDMDSQLRQLQSSWDGQAKQAYEVSKAKWTDGHERDRGDPAECVGCCV